MRQLRQPGEPAGPRQLGLACHVGTVNLTLEPGPDLAARLFGAAAAAGFTSGAFALEKLPVWGLTHNLPSLFDGPEKAAWFAGPFSGDTAVITAGRVTIGLNGGAPMHHCHAAWRTPDGATTGGHLLLDRMRLPEPADVTFNGVSGAVFDVLPDAETNFSIFQPVPQAAPTLADPSGARPGVLAMVAPNVDFAGALSELAAAHGLETAEILSGVGSFVGGVFDNGPAVPDPITEALVTGGRVHAGDPGAARIDAVATDPAGIVRGGRLSPGENAVGITFEVLLAGRTSLLRRQGRWPGGPDERISGPRTGRTGTPSSQPLSSHTPLTLRRPRSGRLEGSGSKWHRLASRSHLLRDATLRVAPRAMRV